jgi:hypothetical protein
MAAPYFSALSHKRHDFRKGLLSTKYVFRLSLESLCETHLILRRNQRFTREDLR